MMKTHKKFFKNNLKSSRWKKQQKDKEKKRSQDFKKRTAERKSKSDVLVVDDERFKSVDTNRFLNKPTKIKGQKEAVPGLLNPKYNSKKSKIDKNKIVPGKKDGRIKRKT